VIVITSHDSIAILLLYRCLRHSHTEHELRTIFHHFNFLKNNQNVSDYTFWKFSYKRKFSFLFVFCTRKRHLTVIEDYIKRNDVIRCEFDLIFFEKIWFTVNKFPQIAVAKSVDRLSQIAVAKTFCWESNYSIFRTTQNWINLFLINDLMKSSIIIWSMNT
jgi:hypothetical protein